MVYSAPILRLAAAVLVCVGVAGFARAQQPDNWMTRLFQPPAPTAVPPGAVPGGPPAPNDAAREWSGQSGASGNPLMSADAIRAATAGFGDCV